MQNISDFIPKDYFVLSEIKGNLNLDNIDDVILVLKKEGEDSLSNAENPLKRKINIVSIKYGKF